MIKKIEVHPNQLETALLAAAASISKQATLPPTDSIRLNIVETKFSYFQNWMLTGPFREVTIALFLVFCMQRIRSTTSPLLPETLRCTGKTYRWHKFATPNGGIIDLDERFGKNSHSSAYAYCNITAERSECQYLLLAAPAGAEVFFNGVKVTAVPGTDTLEGEKKYPLSFKAGINHLLLRDTTRNYSLAVHIQAGKRISR